MDSLQLYKEIEKKKSQIIQLQIFIALLFIYNIIISFFYLLNY